MTIPPYPIDGSSREIAKWANDVRQLSTSSDTDLAAVKAGPFLVVSATAALDNERIVAAESGVLSVTDGGATFTFGVETNGIGDEKIRQSSGLSVIGRSAATLGNVGDITAAVDGHILYRNGTSLVFGNPPSSSINEFPASAVSDASASAVSVTSANAGGTYTAAEQTLINELKTDVNQLVTDLNNAITQLNAALAELRTSGVIST